MRTLKILGFLLTYPVAVPREALDECRMILRTEQWLPKRSLQTIETFIDKIGQTDLLDLQEQYVALFDRTPCLSLHLFEHVHGDSSERGQALADLSNVYANAGLIMNTQETPDYLPLFLEYISTLLPDEIKDHLGSIVDILCALGGRLKNRGSGYAAVFDVLVEAASKKPDPRFVEKALARASGAAFDPETLDKEWQEQFAFDNSDKNTCAKQKRSKNTKNFGAYQWLQKRRKA